ncbi:MAG: acetate kinase [Thermomicrobiales bacterium]
MSIVLVVNAGSSSLKYQILDMVDESVLGGGLVERIGGDVGVATHTGPLGTSRLEAGITSHTAGFDAVLEACAEHGPDLEATPPHAVGHRVVQGGARFRGPVLIDDAVEAAIEELSPLAPLHNPPNLLGIRAARTVFPGVPQVAVFDTAFHQTMPPEAYTYAIDSALAETHGIRRYGFHGTSHKYVSEQAAAFLGQPLDQVNTIVLHIGNGVSACAVRGGVSIDTSMGMTPLEGLVMGTRSGDLDPAILIHLHRQGGLDIDALDELLNRRSGLLGLSGSSDMRDVEAGAAQENIRASLALATYCYRLRHYVGAYYAQLGRVDAIAFTAGVGENSARVRAQTLAGLERLGIAIDAQRNGESGDGIRTISADGPAVKVLIVPTNEELEIARQTLAAIG